MNKFKVGDKVIVKKGFKCGDKIIHESMRKLEGQEVIITEINNGNIRIDKSQWFWTEDDFEIINKLFTKSYLKDGDVVTYRNGDKRTVKDNRFIDVNGSTVNALVNYNDDLTSKFKIKLNDIIKVERPVKYETVFERKEEILNEAEKNI